MGEVIQCDYCGRIGDKVVFDEVKQIIHCNCCGAGTLVRRVSKDEELHQLRYFLAEKILNPLDDFKMFKVKVDEKAEALLIKDKSNFLAQLCHKAIYAEDVVPNCKNAKRNEVLKILEESDVAGNDNQGDLKCTIVFLDFFLKYEIRVDGVYRQRLEEKLNDLKQVAANKSILIEEIAISHSRSVEVQPEEDVNLLEGMLEISDKVVLGMAYRNKYYIDGVIFADTVEQIGDSAFDGCVNLKYVSFGRGVREVGGSAFCGTGITKLHIPSNMKKIGACAFRSCSSLTEVTFKDPLGWKAIYPNGAKKEIKGRELCGRMAFRSLTDSKKYANCTLMKTD